MAACFETNSFRWLGTKHQEYSNFIENSAILWTNLIRISFENNPMEIVIAICFFITTFLAINSSLRYFTKFSYLNAIEKSLGSTVNLAPPTRNEESKRSSLLLTSARLAGGVAITLMTSQWRNGDVTGSCDGAGR